MKALAKQSKMIQNEPGYLHKWNAWVRTQGRGPMETKNKKAYPKIEYKDNMIEWHW